MRTVIELTAAVVMLAGVAMGVYAFTLPSRYVLDNAIQMSGIYSQATFYGVLSIALFAFAGVLMLSLRPQNT
ncbi:MAG: hypothetical protein LCI00_16860 [Chloroflexi bacterium]|nr:hypothetical protein [Chloroflexota bacterium]